MATYINVKQTLDAPKRADGKQRQTNRQERLLDERAKGKADELVAATEDLTAAADERFDHLDPRKEPEGKRRVGGGLWGCHVAAISVQDTKVYRDFAWVDGKTPGLIDITEPEPLADPENQPFYRIRIKAVKEAAEKEKEFSEVTVSIPINGWLYNPLFHGDAGEYFWGNTYNGQLLQAKPGVWPSYAGMPWIDDGNNYNQNFRYSISGSGASGYFNFDSIDWNSFNARTCWSGDYASFQQSGYGLMTPGVYWDIFLWLSGPPYISDRDWNKIDNVHQKYLDGRSTQLYGTAGWVNKPSSGSCNVMMSVSRNYGGDAYDKEISETDGLNNYQQSIDSYLDNEYLSGRYNAGYKRGGTFQKATGVYDPHVSYHLLPCSEKKFFVVIDYQDIEVPYRFTAVTSFSQSGEKGFKTDGAQMGYVTRSAEWGSASYTPFQWLTQAGYTLETKEAVWQLQDDASKPPENTYRNWRFTQDVTLTLTDEGRESLRKILLFKIEDGAIAECPVPEQLKTALKDYGPKYKPEEGEEDYLSVNNYWEVAGVKNTETAATVQDGFFSPGSAFYQDDDPLYSDGDPPSPYPGAIEKKILKDAGTNIYWLPDESASYVSAPKWFNPFKLITDNMNYVTIYKEPYAYYGSNQRSFLKSYGFGELSTVRHTGPQRSYVKYPAVPLNQGIDKAFELNATSDYVDVNNALELPANEEQDSVPWYFDSIPMCPNREENTKFFTPAIYDYLARRFDYIDFNEEQKDPYSNAANEVRTDKQVASIRERMEYHQVGPAMTLVPSRFIEVRSKGDNLAGWRETTGLFRAFTEDENGNVSPTKTANGNPIAIDQPLDNSMFEAWQDQPELDDMTHYVWNYDDETHCEAQLRALGFGPDQFNAPDGQSFADQR